MGQHALLADFRPLILVTLNELDQFGWISWRLDLAIRLSCVCGQSLTAKDAMAGKRFKCPKCGAPVDVPAANKPVYDVFISYSNTDKATADAMCAILEANKVRCWIAPRDIIPGRDWGEAIIDGINACSIMVLVFSSESNRSTQVRREVERAVHRGATLIPFRIEDVPMSKSLEYFLSTHHWLDALTLPLERHLNALTKSVRSLLNSGDSPESRPKTALIPVVSSPPPSSQVISTAPNEEPKASDIAAANAAYDQAVAMAWRGDWNGAILEMSRAIRLDPCFALAYAGRAEYQYAKNLPGCAIVDINEAIRISPGCASYYSFRAVAKQMCLDHDGAVADLDEAIRRSPRNSHFYCLRAMCKLSGDNEGAIADANRAVEIDPTSAEAFMWRGAARLCVSMSGKRREWIAVIADYTEALRLNAGLHNAYQNRGFARLQVGDLEGALSDCERAIELLPHPDAVAYLYRGLVKNSKNDFESALIDFNKSIELNPNGADAYLNRGVARSALNDSEGAMADFDRSLQLDPSNPMTYVLRATVWWSHFHDEERTRADCRRALELNPKLVIPAVLPR